MQPILSANDNNKKNELHVVYCDGTSQVKDQETPTNIAILYDALSAQNPNGVVQNKYYYAGIGTRDAFEIANDNKLLSPVFNAVKTAGNKLNKTFNMVTGLSITAVQKGIYKDIILDHHDGKEYAFLGYSRGGYTVRSLCGMMYKCGILDAQKFYKDGILDHKGLDDAIDYAFDFYRHNDKPSSPRAQRFRKFYNAEQPDIRALVDLDTVGALGIPRNFGWLSRLFKHRYEYHDTKVNRRIEYAVKFTAAEERRRNYMFTPLSFDDVTVSDLQSSDGADTLIHKFVTAGTHGCVGGGDKEYLGLSNSIAVEIAEHLEEYAQLKFDDEVIDALRAASDPTVEPHDDFIQNDTWKQRIMSGGYEDRILPRDAVPSPTALKRFKHVKPYADIHASEEWKKYPETRPYIENRLG